MFSGFSKILANTAASVATTVQSTVSEVVNEVTGPKALSEYELGDQVGSGGPGMLWKLYKATPVSTTKKAVMAEVCVWLLDKKHLADERAKRGTRGPLSPERHGKKKISKAAEDSLLERFRADAKVLQKLRHPGIVRVVEPLDETPWAMALVTEPIFSSVANALGNHDNMPSIPPELDRLELGPLEVKHGLMQLAEALSFIHRNARLIHRGISPESVYMTTNGGWKFAGFGFCTMAEENPDPDDPSFMYPDYDVDHPVLPLQPPLDYTAPELTRPLPLSARAGGLDARLSVDLFSLGLLTYHLVTKRQLLRCNNNADTYHPRVMTLRNLPLNDVPMDLEPELRRMLSTDPTARPTASDFAASRYFTEDMRLKALQFLDQMIGRGNDQRAEFLKSLSGIWSGFDSRVLRYKVLPPLLNELKNPATQLLALPWVLEVVEVQDAKDFQVRTQQLLIPAFEAAHGELLLLFLRHMPALATKASPEIMQSHLLPMMMRAFEDADPRLQEETLRRSIALVPKLDFGLVKEAILPRVHMLALRTSVAAVRIQALVSMGELVPTLDKPCVMDILQTMARCASVDHSPPTLMCIVGVADVVQKEYGMEFAAQHILPLLTPLLTVQQLSNAQFARFLKLIMDILTQLQDKRGVSLSEADSVFLDLASMGLGPANGDAAHAAASSSGANKSDPSSWSTPASDGWAALSAPATASPAKGALPSGPPLSDPFASMPPLSPARAGASATTSTNAGGMQSRDPFAPSAGSLLGPSSAGTDLLGGPSPSWGAPGAHQGLGSPSSSSSLGGSSSLALVPVPLRPTSPAGGPLPDLFSSGPASTSGGGDPFALGGAGLGSGLGASGMGPLHTGASGMGASTRAGGDPFALPPLASGPGMSGLGGAGLGSSMGAPGIGASGMGVPGTGVGALSQGPLGGFSGAALSGVPMAPGSGARGGAGGAGLVSLVPDKPPPPDDPFSDWPPRKPTPAATSQASTRAGVGGAGYTGVGASMDPWGSMQGRANPPTQPGALVALSQPIGGQPGMMRPLGSLAPPPPASSSFAGAAFPAPLGAPPRPQDPFGNGFASPELHAAGPAMVPTDPFNLL